MSRMTNKIRRLSCATRYISVNEPAKIQRFAQMPSFLFEHEDFKPITNEAKVLYTMLLRRSELSRQHGWTDKQGRVYIYFTIEETVDLLHCGRQKAVNTLRELLRVRLLEIRRQGCGRPNRLYPMFCEDTPDREVPVTVRGKPDDGFPDNGGVPFTDGGSSDNGTPEVRFSFAPSTEISPDKYVFPTEEKEI